MLLAIVEFVRKEDSRSWHTAAVVEISLLTISSIYMFSPRCARTPSWAQVRSRDGKTSLLGGKKVKRLSRITYTLFPQRLRKAADI